ncbi:MAG: putative transmembrane protein [Gammaproteobacteria bacterium]|nr:MAG: putative transmembrane protein [Gammaproteobacteria bacterium]TND02284.1 MAG: putative transmembrane protein [Gammaproteobacteria bacterium]
MSAARRGFVALIMAWGSRLRYPQLMALTSTLFVLDILVPDFVPFADEILLGLLTLLIGTRKKRPVIPDPPPGNVIDGEVVERRDARK